MGPLKQWPVTQMRQMMSKHLEYQGRKSLTCFVLVNRGAPNDYANWIMLRNMCPKQDAKDHVASLIKDHKAGLLAFSCKSFVLPFRTAINTQHEEPTWMYVTLPYGDRHGGKKAWVKTAGYGDYPWPVEQLMPLEAPSLMFLVEEGWRWDAAYSTLKGTARAALPCYSLAQQWKTVPGRHPDALEDDE